MEQLIGAQLGNSLGPDSNSYLSTRNTLEAMTGLLENVMSNSGWKGGSETCWSCACPASQSAKVQVKIWANHAD